MRSSAENNNTREEKANPQESVRCESNAIEIAHPCNIRARVARFEAIDWQRSLRRRSPLL